MSEKNTPNVRFAGFNDPWEQRKLGSMSEIVRGASPRPIKDPKWFNNNSDVGWLRISDVTEQNGRIHYLSQKISDLGQQKTRVLTSKHLLLSIAATVGKPVMNYVKTGVHDGFLIFLKPNFNIEFMFQWLEMFRPKWRRYGQPGSQVNLNSDLVRNQIILIPSIEEQRVISDFFTRLDTLIASNQRKLDQLKEVKRFLMQKIFDQEWRFKGFTDPWEQRKLENMVEVNSGRDYKHLKSGNIPVYGTGGYMLSVNGALSENNDAIGIGRKGTIDRPYILKAPFWTVDTLFYAIPKKKNEINFVYGLFQKINWKRKDESTGVPSLSKSTINSIYVYAPKFTEQKLIGIILKKINLNIASNQEKVDQLTEMKKWCMQNMFV